VVEISMSESEMPLPNCSCFGRPRELATAVADSTTMDGKYRHCICDTCVRVAAWTIALKDPAWADGLLDDLRDLPGVLTWLQLPDDRK
jgi:hypothetical protein